MMKKVAVVCLLLFTIELRPQTPAVSASDAWAPLRFLVGAWDARVQGGSAGATAAGQYSFQLELRDHVLARHSAYAECKGRADFNCGHTDLMYVYREPAGQTRAIYFDSEGHVVHYDVSTPAADTAVFTSPPVANGPQFQLSYELRQGVMSGKFQMRTPGQPNFTPYLQWSGRKIVSQNK